MLNCISSDLIKHGLVRLSKFFLVFAGLIFVLHLYLQEATRLSLVPVMQAGEISPEILLFSVFITIPAAIVCIWPAVEKRWSDLFVPTPRLAGIRYLIVVTRWRAAFVSSLICIILIEVLV